MPSFKSNIDRSNLFDVPNFSKLVTIIKNIDDRPWVKPAVAILLSTGCRVGELIYLNRGNIKFIDYDGKEIPNDELLFANVSSIQFNLSTEKNRTNKYRIVPLLKNEIFFELVKIITEYCQKLKFDDTMLFPYTRGAVWYAIKRAVGTDFFPHYIRHASVTNDTRAGISPSIQKSKYGWSDLRPHSVYSHLNFLDILNEQKKVYGESMKEKVVAVIDNHTEKRKDYRVEHPVGIVAKSNERAPIIEATNHPELHDTKEAEHLNNLVKEVLVAVKDLPKSDFKPVEKSEPIPVDLDLEIITPPKKVYNGPKFIGEQLPKSDVDSKQFTRIRDEGKDYVEPGMILKDKVVIVEHNKTKLADVYKKMDPNRVIPVYKPNKAVQTKMANLRELIKKKEQSDADLVPFV
jgi:hypothetical protein